MSSLLGETNILSEVNGGVDYGGTAMVLNAAGALLEELQGLLPA
ncbi:hypothetical protein [Desulfofundulus kuznetsovii]